jgi:hypothetical protein
MTGIKIFVAVVAIVVVAASSFAIPFASQLGRSNSIFPAPTDFKFTYFLNQTAATVTIKIKTDPGGTVVASFAGTTARGLNTVTWDGTNNNAGGTKLPEGNYTFSVDVTGSESAGWNRIASNKTVASTKTTEYSTLPEGWPSRSIIVGTEPTQESYGIVFVSVADGVGNPGGVGPWVTTLAKPNGIFLLNPDTSPYNDTEVYLQNANMDDYTTVWGAGWDPEDYSLWVVGQGTAGTVFHGAWNSASSTDVTGDQLATIQNSRSVAVKGTGASRTLYLCQGGGWIWRYEIGTAPNLTGITRTDILGPFGADDWYCKRLKFDTAGNAYWIGRYESAPGTVAHLERWDAAVFDAATANSLSNTNAAWNLQIGTLIDANAGGIAVSVKNVADPNDDEIYVSLNSTTECGVYALGAASQASKTGTITTTDRVIDLSAEAGTLSGYGCEITADLVGNIYLEDGASEVVYVYSPGGASNNSTPAPASKGFEVAPSNAAQGSWNLYE